MLSPVREVQWFIGRYTPDHMRGEFRNVGIIVRKPDPGPPFVRFMDPPAFLRPEHAEEYKGWVAYWTAVWDKHHTQAFHWLIRRSDKSPHLHFDLGGSRMTASVDCTAMFEELVMPVLDKR